MSRPAAVSADQIRATVLAMLAEAGHTNAAPDGPAPPVTRERFRRAVSVRRLRARLGAGDPAVLSRALNAIEAELVQAGLTHVTLPGLPDAIAEQMRALWAAAVGVQLDDVVRLRQHAQQVASDADTARHDADVRCEMLRVELGELRERLTARDAELADLRARTASAIERAGALSTASVDLQTRLDAARTTLEAVRAAHATELTDMRARYDGLSKRLLQETEHQRHALATERERLTTQLADAQNRIAALEGLRERLLDEVASGRDAHRQAAAEAAALTTVVTEQRRTLAALQTQPAVPRRPTRHNPARSVPPGHAAAAAAAPRPPSLTPRATRPSHLRRRPSP
ncbi:DNA-binding protein [Paraburkholderia sp. SIMBA_049]